MNKGVKEGGPSNEGSKGKFRSKWQEIIAEIKFKYPLGRGKTARM